MAVAAVLVMGAGSVGCFVGGSLAAAGVPVTLVGRPRVLDAIAQRGVPSPVQQQIEKVLTECELALYAPAGSGQQMQQTFSEAASIITGLERTLRA